MSVLRNIYVFIGPPGSGKGSLSSFCQKKLDWDGLSTGDLCRHHIAKETKIGKQIDFALKSGKLVSDSLIVSMVNSWLKEKVGRSSTIILDGYPRTVSQAESFDQLLQQEFKELKVSVVRLHLSDDHIIARIGGRSICSNKKCQAVYSKIPGSSLMAKSLTECDECSSLLIRRVDDDPKVIKKRLKTYHVHEEKLLDYYSRAGRIIRECNTEQPIEKVFDEFKALIGLKNA